MQLSLSVAVEYDVVASLFPAHELGQLGLGVRGGQVNFGQGGVQCSLGCYAKKIVQPLVYGYIGSLHCLGPLCVAELAKVAPGLRMAPLDRKSVV